MGRTTSFGYWLRRRRKALDLTQEELARQVGCAVGTIKKLEGDDRRPSRQMAERLADLLQVVPEERAAFLKAARAELATDQLDVAAEPIESPVMAQPLAGVLPMGTVAFLFTDIEGSTRLWERQPEAMAAALARHDAILREIITSRGGVVFKTVGDAACAAFAVAADALAAALAALRALQAEQWDTNEQLRVRMALHTGAAEVRDGDYFGPPLNRAARLLASGHGGQLLLSAATWELLRDQLPPNVETRDLGVHRFKDLTRPEQVFQLVAPDLPADFPPLRSLDTRHTNLPAQLNALIGRERELTTICDLLRRDDVRLLTLTGPGGTGKTRLSFQVAAELLNEDSRLLLAQRETSEAQRAGWSGGERLFPNGVWFVNLARISEPGLVASAIAQALDVRETGGQPLLDRLKDNLHEKRTLLLLDNFEQIVDAAPLVGELLAAAPDLKVLVTSRMPLHLSGEREFAVPPLALPPPLEPSNLQTFKRSNVRTLTQYEAVRLFIERAQAVKADFAVTNENAPAVAEICYRLDGLPLAIELAAARIKLFPPQALLARLADRLKFLTGGARDLPARQQTIRNTIDWSYDLLDQGEKLLFARLGVFVGGCTLEAAEAVCNGDGGLPVEAVDGVAALLDKSLLRQDEGPDGEPRFTLLETIREYALERLEESGEAEALRRRHAEYFLALAEEGEAQSRGPKQVAWIERLEVEHDNLRAALAWSERSSNVEVWLQLTGSLQWFWFLCGYLNEGRIWSEGALARSSGAVSALRAKVLHGAGRLAQGDDLAKTHALYEESLLLLRKLGDSRAIAELLNDMAWLAYLQGDSASRLARSSESLALYRELDDAWGIASASLSLAGAEFDHGDLEHVQKLSEESLALFRQSGDIGGIGGALQALGALARVRGDNERAVAVYEESMALFRRLGYRLGVLSQLSNLGYMAHRQGDLTRMELCFKEGLVLSKEIGDNGEIAMHLGGLAGALGLTGRPELAARLLGAADALLLALGQPRDWIDSSDHDRVVAATRAQLGEEAFATAWEAGRAMTLEQAIEEALKL